MSSLEILISEENYQNVRIKGLCLQLAFTVHPVFSIGGIHNSIIIIFFLGCDSSSIPCCTFCQQGFLSIFVPSSSAFHIVSDLLDIFQHTSAFKIYSKFLSVTCSQRLWYQRLLRPLCRLVKFGFTCKHCMHLNFS